VDDNGRGFSPPPGADGDGAAAHLAGLGLRIMRYRAQLLGGDLVVSRAGAGGASVRCCCPLEQGAFPG
jgi:signal transduction histidine kinase